MAEEKSCIKYYPWGCGIRFCPCLSKRMKAILASWFFTILHFTIFIFMCKKITWTTSFFSNLLAFLAILTVLSISSASIYGVHSRKKEYIVPFELYLAILSMASCVGTIVGMIVIIWFDESAGRSIVFISSLTGLLAMSSLSNVSDPWEERVSNASPRNANPSRVQESTVNFSNKSPSVIPGPNTAKRVEYDEEKAIILPRQHESNLAKLEFPTSG